MHKNNKFDKGTYESLRVNGSYPGKLYGLPKRHKTGVPMRPINQSISAFNARFDPEGAIRGAPLVARSVVLHSRGRRGDEEEGSKKRCRVKYPEEPGGWGFREGKEKF